MGRGRMKRCAVWLVCLAGAATLLVACGDSTAPDGGQPCQDDLECGLGEYCKDGICTPIGGDQDPRPCGEDSDCAAGEICEGGLCVPGHRPDGGDDGGDGGSDGGDASADGGDSGGDAIGPAPDIFLGGDVVAHQDAQGVTYEINFGNVTMGVPVTRNLTIQNLGEADLVVDVATLTDDPDGEFSLSPQVPPAITVPPGEEHTLVVEYNAADGMTDRAEARLFSNDPDDGQLAVQLISEFKGEAAIAIDPVALDFGDVAIGQASTRDVTIANGGTGNAVLRIDAVAPEASIAAAYDVLLLAADGATELDVPCYVNRGDFITAAVTFLAPARNRYEGDLVITSSDEAASPSTVALRGRAGVPSIAVEPAAIDFGEVPANAWADDATVTVRNEGVGLLTVADIALNPAGDFSLADLPQLPAEIAPGGEVSFRVRYYPEGEGQDTAILSIGHDDPDQPDVQIAVGGTGVQGNARPTAVILAGGADVDTIEVGRGQRVNLDGTDSSDSDGTVTAYDWSLDQQPPPDNCGNPESSLSSVASPTPFLLPERGGYYTVSLRVRDDDDAWSQDDTLTVQAISVPSADIRQGGNDTGFVEVDMGETLQFNGGFSTDCDGSISGYDWSWEAFPAGRGAPPAISGGDQYASVTFDFPGDYTLGLVVSDDDVPANQSAMATFDIRVRGPKAFRVTADWYDLGNGDNEVDVDIHLLRPEAASDWAPDGCCPKEGNGGEECDPEPDWGVHGTPVYQTDGYEDDGVRPRGAPGDEVNLSNPGMGQYTIKVHYRCHLSTDFSGYWCCDDDGPPCWFPFNLCGAAACSRAADGLVTVYVTQHDNTEVQLVQRTFHIDSEQWDSFDTIGTLSWPDGNFQ